MRWYKIEEAIPAVGKSVEIKMGNGNKFPVIIEGNGNYPATPIFAVIQEPASLQGVKMNITECDIEKWRFLDEEEEE